MDNTQNMSQTELALAQHPYLGFISSLMSAMLPFLMGSVMPLMQLAGVMIGLFIGVLTLESKWKERKLKARKKKHHEGN